jgi:peptidoglycan glycosyltransferase
MRSGLIDNMVVSRGAISEPENGQRATMSYSIEYTSEAVGEPMTLQGELVLAFDDADGEWKVRWDRDVLWPGIEDARAFDLIVRWPKRAALFDRNKRPLAIGAAGRRRYPQGSVGGVAVGHIEPATRAHRRDEPLLEIGDLVGASGLELAFNDVLTGQPASELVVRGRGKSIVVLGRSPAQPGRPVRTTLDVAVQRAAETGFGSTVGGAVVIDPRRGNVLAAVPSGSFDPSNYVGVANVQPFNRALSGLYPPGSSLKAMTAAAALDSGKVTRSTRLTGPADYRGVRNFESGEFGTIDFASALKFSVNTAFAQVAEKLGPRLLMRYARAFGFNRAPKMTLHAATSSFPFPTDEGDLLWGSIGQAQVLASPLHMATVAATIGNDGLRMEPRIAMSEPKRSRRVIDRRTAQVLTELMREVVEGGTGTAARISGLAVAGKTGTAEVDVGGERRNHAWFICFAPADDPKIAVAVVSEYGGVGGQVAAPVARAILTRVLPLVR